MRNHRFTVSLIALALVVVSASGCCKALTKVGLGSLASCDKEEATTK